MSDFVIEKLDIASKRDRARFVDIGRRFARSVPNSVPQLRSEQMELLDPGRNPFFAHAKVQLFVARHGRRLVGRISAHIDFLARDMPAEQGFGPGSGMFGYFDADNREIAAALLAAAEDWLQAEGTNRVLGPISLSIWEEPGLLVKGEDRPPTVMMGHHPAQYAAWIAGEGYRTARTLLTYDLDITQDFPPLIERIIQSGERNDRIVVREAGRVDYDGDVAIILGILNDAWSDNWGFVPFTAAEVAYAAKKLKPLIHPELVHIAELDGQPVAFMITLPDMNEVLSAIQGRLFPFGWVRLLHWLRRPAVRQVRVPLMGVLKRYQSSRLASQLAFMMIEYIRRSTIAKFGATRGEIGWILEDNQGMIAIAEAIDCSVNREYTIFEKNLS